MGICVDRAWLGGVCTLLRAAPDPTHVHVIAEGRVGPVLEAALGAHGPPGSHLLRGWGGTWLWHRGTNYTGFGGIPALLCPPPLAEQPR